MKLEKHETQSALWQKLESHIHSRISDLRSSNDADLDPIATARLRGRIASLRELLSLSQDETVLGGDS